MSIVIVGGNERMAGQYEMACRERGHKVKVFTKEKGPMKKKIGEPDLLVLFTGTVSHKMVAAATGEAKKNQIPIAWAHSSSISALNMILEEYGLPC